MLVIFLFYQINFITILISLGFDKYFFCHYNYRELYNNSNFKCFRFL